ncbi:MAG: DUF1439 domain-containing protein [Candidatus Eisenbacteria bacterium]
MKKTLALAGIAIIVCSGISGCNLTREGYVIKITPEQIQEKLNPVFPISKRYLAVFKLTLKDPTVSLKEGSNRIGFGVTAATNVSVSDTDLAGRAHMTAGIRFDPEEASLSLVDPLVETLDISLLPEKYHDEVMLAATIVAKEYLDDYEVYRLELSGIKQAIAKMVLKSVLVEDGVLNITLGFGE